MNLDNLNIALLSFIPGIINLGIFIYSYFILQKSKLSVVFSMLVFSAMVWQIAEGFLKLTLDIETAKRLFILTQSGTLILIASCFYFSLLFTKRINDNNKALFYFLIYLSALFFIVANVLQWTNNEYTYSDSFGFIDTTKSTLFSIEVLYLSLVGIITLYFLIVGITSSGFKMPQ